MTTSATDMPLTDSEWDALARAERPFYTPSSGIYAWTDVNIREESGVCVALHAPIMPDAIAIVKGCGGSFRASGRAAR